MSLCAFQKAVLVFYWTVIHFPASWCDWSCNKRKRTVKSQNCFIHPEMNKIRRCPISLESYISRLEHLLWQGVLWRRLTSTNERGPTGSDGSLPLVSTDWPANQEPEVACLGPIAVGTVPSRLRMVTCRLVFLVDSFTKLPCMLICILSWQWYWGVRRPVLSMSHMS